MGHLKKILIESTAKSAYVKDVFLEIKATVIVFDSEIMF